MSNDQDDEYNDSNRAFLQALIANSTLTFEEAQRILAAILTAYNKTDTTSEDITRDIFDSYIEAANDAVSHFDMEVRSTTHQITKQRIYAIINSTSDPSTQMATRFTPDEISFVKRVLDAMFETNNTLRHEVMAIQSIQATRLHKPSGRPSGADGDTQGTAGGAITQLQVEKVLSSLVEQGWFEKSRKLYYSLSPRALMELRGWLEQTYNDEEEDGPSERGPRIKACHACREIVTYGQRCAKLICHCRLHDDCAGGTFRMQRNKSCPLCKTQWTGNDFVGERADKKATGSRPSNAGQSQAGPSRAAATQQNGVSDDDDEDD